MFVVPHCAWHRQSKPLITVTIIIISSKCRFRSLGSQPGKSSSVFWVRCVNQDAHYQGSCRSFANGARPLPHLGHPCRQSHWGSKQVIREGVSRSSGQGEEFRSWHCTNQAEGGLSQHPAHCPVQPAFLVYRQEGDRPQA